MIVQELLKLADIEKQTELQYQHLKSMNKDIDRETVKTMQFNFINMLLDLQPVASKDMIIFEKAWESLEDSTGTVLIHPACYEYKDIMTWLNKYKEVQSPVTTYNADDTVENLKVLCEKFESDMLPMGYGIDFTPWEEVLGCTVYIENCEELGLQECIYTLLIEMTFNGYTREEQKEREDSLLHAIDEAVKLENLPEEEKAKQFVDFEELLKELGVDDFLVNDDYFNKDERPIWLGILRRNIWNFNNLKKLCINL